MKGLITKGLLLGCVGGSLTLAGCQEKYNNLVDPCYPQRYEAMAREEVLGAIAPQVANGHVLDQTMWNYHFEPGTDKLTAGAQVYLGYIARRRPSPDTLVYVQTAQDLTYDPAAPAKFSDTRTELDARRIQAVKNYLQAYSAGRGLTFEVALHDPSGVGMPATAAALSVLKKNNASQGVLPTTGGAGTSGGAGAGAGAAAPAP